MPIHPQGEATFLQVLDSIRLRYEKSGSGLPLVLVHTIRTQLEHFRDLAPILAKSYTVYAIDLPGHGHSTIDARVRKALLLRSHRTPRSAWARRANFAPTPIPDSRRR